MIFVMGRIIKHFELYKIQVTAKIRFFVSHFWATETLEKGQGHWNQYEWEKFKRLVINSQNL